MNGQMNHLKYMLIGGAGLVGVLLLVGMPLQNALVLAVVLTCPLMMLMGGHGGGHNHDQTPQRGETSQSRDPGSDSMNTPRHH